MIGTLRARLPGRPRRSFGALVPGLNAIGVKELRSRMRGRRAFVVVTVNLLLLAGFTWMVEQIAEGQQSVGFAGAGAYAAASIGRTVFISLMILQTLMVAVLAPTSTSGAISSEREKQTLDLLAVTPISSLAIVVGKLLSALSWIFILIISSIPITAMVFLFGGVAPDDLVRGYVVLFATAIGFGSVGLFFSSLTRRTGAATGLTYVVVLVFTVGMTFTWVFLRATASDPFSTRRPPEALFYWNPFVAQLDVACGTEEGFGGTCSFIDEITGGSPVFGSPEPDVPTPDVKPGGGGGIDFGSGEGGMAIDRDLVGPANVNGRFDDRLIVGDVGPAMLTSSFRDRFWPQSVVAWLLLSVILTIASVQLVTPTRRWRPRLPGFLRRLDRRTAR